jgi:hypothetical protein
LAFVNRSGQVPFSTIKESSMSELEHVKNIPESEQAQALAVDKPVQLAVRATMLDQRAFTAVNSDDNPLKRGFLALLVVIGVVAVARLIGMGLDLVTMPRVNVLQEQILTAITNTNYFAGLIANTPEIADRFAETYGNIWNLIRLLGGYPSTTGVLGVLLSLLAVLGSWLIFSSFSYLIARWFGTQVDYKRALGVMALAYSPILLKAIDIIPGAIMPTFLIFALTLIAKFLAVRELYKFGPGKNLAMIILTYAICLILWILILLSVLAFMLNQYPIIDDVLRVMRYAAYLR